MLFFCFFWAFFHASFCPSIELGTKWPPSGISLINVYDYPLYNTFLLIISGFAVTRVHRGIALVYFAKLWILSSQQFC
jgi:cytochrome c oxidase subunit 3